MLWKYITRIVSSADALSKKCAIPICTVKTRCSRAKKIVVMLKCGWKLHWHIVHEYCLAGENQS